MSTHAAPVSSASLPPSPDAVANKLRDLVIAGDDADDARIHSGALFARLKALNRAANGATRSHKQATADARHEMDQTHLGLQNLLYEKRHLEREIEKCRQFASIYQDVPLYPLDEFKELAPAEIATPQLLADEHQLMLARLNFELAERQRLDARRRELVQLKEDLLKQSKTKQTTMDGVKAQIDLLMKTSADIRKKIDDLVGPAAVLSISGSPSSS